MLETVLNFIDAVAVAVILAFLFGVLLSSFGEGLLVRLGIGVLFGVGGWFAILSPVAVQQGMYFDLRAVFIVLSAAFLGWQAGAVTLIMVIVGRLWFQPMPPAGWSLMGWVFVSLAAQYAAALVWRAWHPAWQVSAFAKAVVLVVLAQGIALAFTQWTLLLSLPGFLYVLEIQYVVRSLGLLLAALVMLREYELLHMSAKTQDQALRDPLTGALNRRGLEQVLPTLGQTVSLTVICTDVDRFKKLNDTAGHLAGDAVLQALVRRFRALVPVRGYLCRWGGDEIIAIAPDLDLDGAQDLARSLVEAMRDLAIPEYDGLSARVSVGVAIGSPDVEFMDLLHQADAALYTAKAHGGDRVGPVTNLLETPETVGKERVAP